jgi:general secretion pathway protein I
VPKLPEAKLGDLNLNAALGGDAGASSSGGPFAALAQLNQGSGMSLGGDGGIGDLAQSLMGGGAAPGLGAGDPSAAASSAMGGLASMAMGLVYPQLKGILEASSRRVSVTVSWVEGKKEHSFEVMMWVTSPQNAGLLGEAGDVAALGGAAGAGALGGGMMMGGTMGAGMPGIGAIGGSSGPMGGTGATAPKGGRP